MITSSSSSNRPDGVVGTAADDELVPVLEASDAPLVSVQSSDKFTGGRVPYLTNNQSINQSCVPIQ